MDLGLDAGRTASRRTASRWAGTDPADGLGTRASRRRCSQTAAVAGEPRGENSTGLDVYRVNGGRRGGDFPPQAPAQHISLEDPGPHPDPPGADAIASLGADETTATP